MMSRMRLAVTSLIGLAVVGCGSPAKKECTYLDAPTAVAPAWVCTGSMEGVEVSAVGSYERTAAGIQFQTNQAVAAARVNLAQNMKTHVANMIKQYAETTGAGSTETVDRVNTSVSKLITNETVSGTKMLQRTVSPTGTLYVLVGMDRAAVANAAKDAVSTSMRNEAALWQQFQASKAQDELAAGIAGTQVKK